MNQFCQNCGAPLVEGSRFCEQCGASVPDTPTSAPTPAPVPTPPPAPKKKSTLTIVLVIVIVALVAIIAVGAVFLIPALNDDNDDSGSVRKYPTVTTHMTNITFPIDPYVTNPYVTYTQPPVVVTVTSIVTVTQPTTTTTTTTTTTVTTTTTAHHSPQNGLIIPDSSSRYVTQAEADAMTRWEVMIALNEIYARHGRLFSSDDLRTYFEAQPWYHGYIAPDAFDIGVFNDFERQNTTLLRAELDERNARGEQ